MVKLLASLFASWYILSGITYSIANASTHVSFDNETAFFTYLIEETIVLYTPEADTSIAYKKLIIDDRLEIKFPFMDTAVEIETPFHILDQNFDGASIKIEYHF